MTYLAAYSLGNAYKVRELLRSGQLGIHSGLTGGGQFHLNFNEEKIIVAPQPTQAMLLNQSLPIDKADPLGGLAAHPVTLQTLNYDSKFLCFYDKLDSKPNVSSSNAFLRAKMQVKVEPLLSSLST